MGNSSSLDSPALELSNWHDEYFKLNDYLIGTGAFGKVWLVKSKQAQHDKYFAMKEIDLYHPSFHNTKALSYALQESEKMREISHKHIVTLINSCRDLNTRKIFIIMDYCNGGSLRNRIHLQLNKRVHNANRTVHFSENLIWYWSLQMLDALAYIHAKNIIHRDLKPDNVFINACSGECKLGDFGLAKILETNELNPQYMSQVGTPYYMSPELRRLIQAQNGFESSTRIYNAENVCRRYSKEGDVFALGCILFELAMLKQAIVDFSGRFNELNETVYSARLNNLIRITLNEDPRQRPTADSLLNLDYINEIGQRDLAEAYRANKVPSIDFERCFSRGDLSYIPVAIEAGYKPVEMVYVQTKANNYLFIALNRYMNKGTGFFQTISRSFSFAASLTSLSSGSGPAVVSGNNSSYSLSSDFGSLESEPRSFDTVHVNDLRQSAAAVGLVNQSSNEKAKIAVYSEFGELVRQFEVFGNGKGREAFNFKILGMCVDEERGHLYVSTCRGDIMRFRFDEAMSELELDGVLDLEIDEIGARPTPTALCLVKATNSRGSGVSLMTQSAPQFGNSDDASFVTCVNSMTLFNEVAVGSDYEVLLFGDRENRRLIKMRVWHSRRTPSGKIRCECEWGVTVDKSLYPQQILKIRNEIFCLLSDLSTVAFYNFETCTLMRDNRLVRDVGKLNAMNYFCVDSDGNFYTTNGHSFYAINVRTFRIYQKFKPRRRCEAASVEGLVNLFESIAFMQILNNGKLALLKDAIQTENSELYVLKPS